jgi:hypothetical protein
MMLTSQTRSHAFQVAKSPKERKELNTIRSLSAIIAAWSWRGYSKRETAKSSSRAPG